VIKLTIPGKPMAKQRPRVLKNGITYTPRETVNYETLVRQLYIAEHFQKQLDGPLQVRIKAYFPIPKSASKVKKAAMEAGDIRPTKKPDWDNVGKLITDALNNLAYHDDSQIVNCTVEKYYSKQSRVEVEIEEVWSCENTTQIKTITRRKRPAPESVLPRLLKYADGKDFRAKLQNDIELAIGARAKG
jgi:Holliday junction resolvase RusA-like endonuclease